MITVPRWEPYWVLLSLWTDPQYISHRLGRRLSRWKGVPKSTAGREQLSASAHACATADDCAHLSGSPSALVSDIEIDLVYLWVQGQDPVHRKKRKRWRQKCNLDPEVADPDVRYVEQDELRYSLRTAELFLPWVRRVFLVTDKQVPEWLNLSHTKVRLVDHSAFVRTPEWLPTFNSNAIAAQLHEIEALSEHFIICDDDTLFGQPCRKEDFFDVSHTNRMRVVMKVMLSNSDDDWIIPSFQLRADSLAELWMDGWNNVKVALETRRPWWKVRRLDIHQAQPMLKSELRLTAARFAGAYQATCAHKFRSRDDLNFCALTKYRCLQDGCAERGDVPHSVFSRESQLSSYLRSNLPKLFCINDGAGESARRERDLQRLFPDPSSFELPAFRSRATQPRSAVRS